MPALLALVVIGSTVAFINVTATASEPLRPIENVPHSMQPRQQAGWIAAAGLSQLGSSGQIGQRLPVAQSAAAAAAAAAASSQNVLAQAGALPGREKPPPLDSRDDDTGRISAVRPPGEGGEKEKPADDAAAFGNGKDAVAPPPYGLAGSLGEGPRLIDRALASRLPSELALGELAASYGAGGDESPAEAEPSAAAEDIWPLGLADRSAAGSAAAAPDQSSGETSSPASWQRTTTAADASSSAPGSLAGPSSSPEQTTAPVGDDELQVLDGRPAIGRRPSAAVPPLLPPRQTGSLYRAPAESGFVFRGDDEDGVDDPERGLIFESERFAAAGGRDGESAVAPADVYLDGERLLGSPTLDVPFVPLRRVGGISREPNAEHYFLAGLVNADRPCHTPGDGNAESLDSPYAQTSQRAFHFAESGLPTALKLLLRLP